MTDGTITDLEKSTTGSSSRVCGFCEGYKRKYALPALCEPSQKDFGNQKVRKQSELKGKSHPKTQRIASIFASLSVAFHSVTKKSLRIFIASIFSIILPPLPTLRRGFFIPRTYPAPLPVLGEDRGLRPCKS